MKLTMPVTIIIIINIIILKFNLKCIYSIVYWIKKGYYFPFYKFNYIHWYINLYTISNYQWRI